MLAHRHADQRPAVAPEERVHLVVGTVPVQVDVGEQPVLRVGVPLEVQAELAADAAVCAVGADNEISCDGPHGASRLDDRGGDAAGILAEAVELGSLLDAAAELADPLTQDGLGQVLRDVEHEAESRPIAGQFKADQGLAVGVHVEAAHYLALLDEPLGQAHHVEHFERARVNAQGACLQDYPVALVDDPGPDAAGQELAGQHEAGRPRAHDQDLAIATTGLLELADACHDRRLDPGASPGHRKNYRGPTYLSAATRTRRPRPPAACGC